MQTAAPHPSAVTGSLSTPGCPGAQQHTQASAGEEVGQVLLAVSREQGPQVIPGRRWGGEVGDGLLGRPVNPKPWWEEGEVSPYFLSPTAIQGCTCSSRAQAGARRESC